MPELPLMVFAPLLAMIIVSRINWRRDFAGITIPLCLLFYLGITMRDYKLKMARYIASEQRMNSTLVEYVNGNPGDQSVRTHRNPHTACSEAVAEYHDSTLAWFHQSWIWMRRYGLSSPVRCSSRYRSRLAASVDGLHYSAFMVCITIPLGFIEESLKFSQAVRIPRMDTCLNVVWDF